MRGEIETTYLGFANGWGADGIETKERLLSMMRTYLMASDISLGGSCWRENLGSTNQSTYSFTRSLRSTPFGFLLGLVVHHPRPPRPTGPRVSLLSDRECERCVRLRTSRYADTLRTSELVSLVRRDSSNFRSRMEGEKIFIRGGGRLAWTRQKAIYTLNGSAFFHEARGTSSCA